MAFSVRRRSEQYYARKRRRIASQVSFYDRLFGGVVFPMNTGRVTPGNPINSGSELAVQFPIDFAISFNSSVSAGDVVVRQGNEEYNLRDAAADEIVPMGRLHIGEWNIESAVVGEPRIFDSRPDQRSGERHRISDEVVGWEAQGLIFGDRYAGSRFTPANIDVFRAKTEVLLDLIIGQGSDIDAAISEITFEERNVCIGLCII